MSNKKTYMTSDDLISSIKRRASIPDTQSMISDKEILEFANEEMMLNFTPLIVSKHEDYYLTRQEIPIVAGQIRYPIPYRAIGLKLREVAFRASNSKNLSEMFRISIDEVTASYTNNGSYAKNFYLEGEEIVLHADPNHNFEGDLIIFYNLRPNALVLNEEVAIINNITHDTNTGLSLLELTSFPTDFTTLTECDIIMTKSPHRCLKFDIPVEITNEGLRYIQIMTDYLPSTMSVGDRVAFSGQSDVINAPSDLHVMLAQMVASRVLESVGDLDNLSAADKKLKKMENNAALLTDNRVTGSPYKAKVRNGTIRRSGLSGRGRNSTN